MKHLKTFEISSRGYTDDSLNFIYSEGDYVFLLYCDPEDITDGFNTDEMYKIISVDKSDYKTPYEISNNKEDIWVREDQLRLAYNYEIQAKKYNI